MQKTINLGVDLDGCVYNFQKAYTTLARQIYGDRCWIADTPEKVLGWHWHDWYPLTVEEAEVVWRKLLTGKNFWMSLELMDKVSWEYFKRCFMDLPTVNVYYITSREPSLGKSILKQSVDSLKSIGWKDPQIIVSFEKHKLVDDLKLDYFIDDRLATIVDIAKNCQNCVPFIYDYPYSKDSTVARHAKNLKDFSRQVLEMIGADIH